MSEHTLLIEQAREWLDHPLRSYSPSTPRLLAGLADAVEQLQTERDQLRELLVSAEGYAIANGADLPFVAMFAEDSPLVSVIERAGCYPRDARREHPGRFALNRPPAALLGGGED